MNKNDEIQPSEDDEFLRLDGGVFFQIDLPSVSESTDRRAAAVRERRERMGSIAVAARDAALADLLGPRP